MKYFEAKLIVRGKRQVRPVLAESKQEAYALAQGSGMVIGLKERAMPVAVRLRRLREKLQARLGTRALPVQELTVVMRQIGVMLNAGISMNDALYEAVSATENRRLAAVVQQAIEDVEAGQSLSQSLSRHRAALGNITLAMVTLGEKTGTLAESLLKLADILEELRDNRAKIKKAVRMPAISLSAMVVAFVVLILLVVPKFQTIFNRLGADLPLPTQVLIGLEHLFSHYGLWILVGLFVAFVGARKGLEHNATARLHFDRLVLKLYLVGDLMKRGFYGRFMLIFSELIRSGIPLTEAMETAAGTIENRFIRTRIADASRGIEQGKSLSVALEETRLFEPMVLQMVRSGESSGELDTMLGRIADYYKMRFNQLVDNFSALLEPILMALIAALVLLIALGIFLPMWDISNAAMGR
jgi:type II secretory pathway component PulF